MDSNHTDLRKIKGERTRTRIVEAADQILEEQGIRGFSTRSIARAAGLSQSSLYHHFPDLDAILFDTMMRKVKSRISALEEAQSANVSEYFVNLFDNINESLSRNHSAKGFFTIMERAMFDPVFSERLNQMSRHIQASLLETLRKIGGSKMTPEHLELASFAVTILREGYISHVTMHGEKSPFNDPAGLARQVFALIGHCIDK